MHACRRGETKHLIIYGILMRPSHFGSDKRGNPMDNDNGVPMMISADISPAKYQDRCIVIPSIPTGYRENIN